MNSAKPLAAIALPSRKPTFRSLASFLAISILFVSLPAPATAQQQPQTPVQEIPGQVVGTLLERQLRDGETHSFQLFTPVGQYVRLVIEQKGVDAVLLLFAPDGKKLAEADSPNGSRGVETAAFIAEITGTYRVEVRAIEKPSSGGRYVLKIEESRLATPQDRPRILAEQALTEANEIYKDLSAEAARRALAKYEEAARLFESVGDHRMLARTLKTIGVVSEFQAEQQKAFDAYTRILPIVSYLEDSQEPATTHYDIARVSRTIFNYQKAAEHYAVALTLFRASGNRKKETEMLVGLGATYIDMGEKQKALNYFNQALSLSQADQTAGGQLQALTYIGGIYLSMDAPRPALDYYHRALDIAERLKRRMDPAVILTNIGNAYSNLDEHQKALEIFSQSLKLRREIGDVAGEGSTLSAMGRTYFLLGDFPKAMDSLTQALALFEESNYLIGKATVFSNLGRCYQALGDREKAADYYDRALQIKRAIEDKQGESVILYHLATLERDRGNRERAIQHVAAAVRLVESLRTKINIQELRASFLASSQAYYEFYIDLLMQGGGSERLAAALQVSERARARTLLDSLNEVRVDIRQGIDVELLHRERSLRLQLNSKSYNLIRLLNGKPAPDQVAAARQEINFITTQLQQVEAIIRQTNPRYAALTQPQPLSAEEIQKTLLDEDSLLLEYSLGKERSYLWAITPTKITAYTLPNLSIIDAAARRFYGLLTSRNQVIRHETVDEKQDRLTRARAELPQAAAALSQLILAPVASELKDKRLLIVSDGALQYIPFAALPSPNSATAVALSVTNEIVNLPSASTLAVLRGETVNRKPAPKTIAIFADPVFDKSDERFLLSRATQKGSAPVVAQARTRAVTRGSASSSTQPLQTSARPDGEVNALVSLANHQVPAPEKDVTRAAREVGFDTDGFTLPRLPYTRQEAKTIAGLVAAAQRRQAVDFDANKAAAISTEYSQYRYIHFATHGFINTEHPELSGIALSMIDETGKEQDGFLRTHEIYNLRMPAELVVLSGCRTGLGKELRGEGLIGLTRGFMYAGAARVLVSLWDVSDQATADFMGRFYQAMLGKEKLSPAAALRAAQVSMAREARWSSPYFWAAFVLQGEPK